ncbi:MAG: hypothetical protein ACYDBQ_00165 [Thermoplasmatota archaeon]
MSKAAPLFVILVAGCMASTGGIFGVATQGPTCPVQRTPPDPACADRPYQGKLSVMVKTAWMEDLATNATGAFRLPLPPGTYSVASPAGQSLPRCAGGPVTVNATGFSEMTVSCDTGIR